MSLRACREPDGAWCFELLPNRSSSWLQVKRFLTVTGLIDGLIALVFAWQGLWLVAPFSGLAVTVLAVGLYCCSRASYRRELILLGGDRVVVLRGRQQVESREEFARAWVRLHWQPVTDAGCSCLRMGLGGRFLEIGAFLPERERCRLAGQLGRLLGQGPGARAPEIAPDTGLNREMGL